MACIRTNHDDPNRKLEEAMGIESVLNERVLNLCLHVPSDLIQGFTVSEFLIFCVQGQPAD